ncbi:MAG: serine/threonine-protein kinase [Gemmataceae bacterium]
MATPTADVTEYVSLLSKSKLLPQEEVDSIVKRWQDESGGGTVEAFSKYLVSKRVLTPWQSAMLQRGRADGFFLERYKILDQIGKGQMGGVYKAVHSLGQMVALKILPASRAKDPRVLGRFQREARLLTQLDHPNVVRAFQVGDSGGRHFIVMEFLEGETLDEVLQRRKKLPVPEAVRLIRQALDGLQHLEDKRMVHRDLKPANLMIVPAGGKGAADTTLDATVKIVDIGLGRELFDESAPEGLIDTQLTVEGAVVGTPDYMAPEQAKDARSADIRADMYSLGCVLYHAITGRTPFPDTNIMTQMLRHATEMPQPLEKYADVPPGLQETLEKLIAKRPEDRFQTPAQASEAFKRFQTPGAGGEAVKADMAPAFKQWLETESHVPSPEPVKPKTAPAPALPPPPKPAPLPPPPAYAAPRPAPMPPAPPQPMRPATPQPYPVPQQPWQPQPIPYPKTPHEIEVDVELVSLPSAGAPAPQQVALIQTEPASRRRAEADRPLTDLTRRDLMLMAMGGGGVVLSMTLGFTLTRLLRSTVKPPPTEGDDKKE